MDEKKIKKVEELLTAAEQAIEAGDVEQAKAKIAGAKEELNSGNDKDKEVEDPLPGTGSNGLEK